MNEIVIYVDKFHNGGVACHVDSPYNIDDVISNFPIDDLAGLTPPGVVRELGRLLAARICANPSVRRV